MEFIASSKSSSVSSSKGLTLKIPVLLTSTSTPPKRRVAAATKALAVSGLLVSPAKSSTLWPDGSSSSLAAAKTSCLRLLSTTLAPSWRNRPAAALPIPPPPPVMSTTLFSNSMTFSLAFVRFLRRGTASWLPPAQERAVLVRRDRRPLFYLHHLLLSESRTSRTGKPHQNCCTYNYI